MVFLDTRKHCILKPAKLTCCSCWPYSGASLMCMDWHGGMWCCCCHGDVIRGRWPGVWWAGLSGPWHGSGHFMVWLTPLGAVTLQWDFGDFPLKGVTIFRWEKSVRKRHVFPLVRNMCIRWEMWNWVTGCAISLKQDKQKPRDHSHNQREHIY